MVTIYFDTSFYVDLGRADNEKASKVIRGLNELDVRGVCSLDILREMLPYTAHPGWDARLVERLLRFRQRFLQLDESAWWELLLLRGRERKQAVTQIKRTREKMDLAASFSVDAQVGEPMSAEEMARMTDANPKLLEEAGFSVDDDGISVSSHTLEKLSNQMFSGVLPSHIESECAKLLRLAQQASDEKASIDGSDLDEEIENTFERFQNKMRAEFPDVMEAREARSDIFRNDDRPRDIVLDHDRDKNLSRVSNSYRDAGHIGRFIAHADRIDLLQLDRAQYNRFHNTKEPSRLEERGLLSRCFHAPGLDDVLDIVEERLRELQPEQSGGRND